MPGFRRKQSQEPKVGHWAPKRIPTHPCFPTWEVLGRWLNVTFIQFVIGGREELVLIQELLVSRVSRTQALLGFESQGLA